MKAIYTKPGKIVEYAGELHCTDDIKIEVEVLQFVKSFFGTIAICKVGNIFQEIPLDELKLEDPMLLEMFR